MTAPFRSKGIIHDHKHELAARSLCRSQQSDVEGDLLLGEAEFEVDASQSSEFVRLGRRVLIGLQSEFG